MCWQNMFFENTDYSYDKHDEASVSSQLLYTDFMKSETSELFSGSYQRWRELKTRTPVTPHDIIMCTLTSVEISSD